MQESRIQTSNQNQVDFNESDRNTNDIQPIN